MLIEERAVPVLRNSCLACGGQEERELEEDKLVEDKLLEVERGREGEHHQSANKFNVFGQPSSKAKTKIHMVL